MFAEKSAWAMSGHATRNRTAKPAALNIVPPVAEAIRRPGWTDARTAKPNRTGAAAANNTARAWHRGCSRGRTIGADNRRRTLGCYYCLRIGAVRADAHGRSSGAARMLWLRALDQFRKQNEEGSEDQA